MDFTGSTESEKWPLFLMFYIETGVGIPMEIYSMKGSFNV
jgi:hypothetical protein